VDVFIFLVCDKKILSAVIEIDYSLLIINVDYFAEVTTLGKIKMGK